MAGEPKLPPGAVLVDDSAPQMKLPPGAALIQDAPPESDQPQHLARTPGNYASEIAYGVGRGIRNNAAAIAAPVAGAFHTILHPIDSLKEGYEAVRHPGDTEMGRQTHEAWEAAKKAREDYKDSSLPARLGGPVLAAAEKAPIIGGMVQKAESGDGALSPESFGAAAEAFTTFEGPRIAGKGVKAAATSKMVTSTIPAGLINSLIRPMAADVKFGKAPARAILREGLVGNSLEQLGDAVYDRARSIGKEMDLKANDPAIASKVVDVSDSLKPIDKAMRDATKSGNKALYDKLVDLKEEITQDYKQFKPANGQMTIRAKGPKNLKMSPAEALEYKRQIGDRIRWDGNDPFNNDLNAVKGEVYGALKDKVNQVFDTVPGPDGTKLRDLNERYSDLVGAGKAIERRIPVHNRNHTWSLSDIALGASGHLPTALARKGLSHPAVTTRVAQGLYSLGK